MNFIVYCFSSSLLLDPVGGEGIRSGEAYFTVGLIEAGRGNLGWRNSLEGSDGRD